MVEIPTIRQSVMREDGDVINIEVPREDIELSALEVGEGVTLAIEKDGQIHVFPADGDKMEEILSE